MFLQMIDSNIFNENNQSEDEDDDDTKYDGANGKTITNFTACLQNSNSEASSECLQIEIESYVETSKFGEERYTLQTTSSRNPLFSTEKMC